MSELMEMLAALSNEICNCIPNDRLEKAEIGKLFRRCIELANEPSDVFVANYKAR